MKLISAVVATFALSLSLLVSGTATAAPAVYPGSVTTTCGFIVPRVDGPHRLRVRMHVTAGNATPTGHVTLRLRKRTASGHYRLVRNPTLAYAGGTLKYKFRHLKRGRYKVKYFYTPPTNSVFKSCASVTRRARVTG